MIVLFAQVAKPNVMGGGSEVLTQSFGGKAIVHVTTTTRNAILQELGVRAIGKHLCVVVGFDDQIARTLNVRHHIFREMPSVGNQTERGLRFLWRWTKDVFPFFGFDEFDEVTIVVVRIVRNLEGGDSEIADGEGGVEGRHLLTLIGHFLCHKAVSVHPFVYQSGGINGDAKLLRERSDGLDVVGMVVSDKNGGDGRNGKTVVAQVLFESTNTDAEIDDNGRSARFEIVTVARTTTTKTYKFQKIP